MTAQPGGPAATGNVRAPEVAPRPASDSITAERSGPPVVTDSTPPSAKHRHRRRRRALRAGRGLVQLVTWGAVVGLVVAWAFTLRPVAFGGPATFVGVHGSSMLPTLRSGDLVVMHRAATYRVGDVVVYRVPAGQPGAGHLVVHRIAGRRADGAFVMRGDNNSYDDVWHPRPTDVEGRLWARLPGVATAVGRLARPEWFAGAVGLLALVVLGIPSARRSGSPSDSTDSDSTDSDSTDSDSQPAPSADDASLHLGDAGGGVVERPADDHLGRDPEARRAVDLLDDRPADDLDPAG